MAATQVDTQRLSTNLAIDMNSAPCGGEIAQPLASGCAATAVRERDAEGQHDA